MGIVIAAALLALGCAAVWLLSWIEDRAEWPEPADGATDGSEDDNA